MFLSILVPYYNEGEEVIRPLLDSIQFQQNIDLSTIEVIICKDGESGQDLSQEFLDRYTYSIQYHTEPKGGVSKMRNQAFNYSKGDYVMWCDCDDQFYHCLALWLIKRETTTPMQVMVDGRQTTINGFDALYAVFLEEGRVPEGQPNAGETYFIDRKDGFQFVHSKVFLKEFLVRNDIHFFDSCTIHEDNVLNAQVQACTKYIKWCPQPFYLWKWRDSSVCRRDPLYIKKTYPDLIKSSDCLLEWFTSKGKMDKAREAMVAITLDSYYVFCHPSWKEISTKEYRDGAERRFSEYFKKWEHLWTEAPDQMKMQISAGIRNREVQMGMEMETETLDQYITRMKNLS